MNYLAAIWQCPTNVSDRRAAHVQLDIFKYIKDIQDMKDIQDIQEIHRIPSDDCAALPGPAPMRGPRSGPGRIGAVPGRSAPATAWYFVYILYILYIFDILDILDILGYIQFVYPAGRRIIVKHIDRRIDRTLPYVN